MNWVREQFDNQGFVTRNQALRNYISRLAARINDLREVGWEIKGEKINNDYKYTLINKSNDGLSTTS